MTISSFKMLFFILTYVLASCQYPVGSYNDKTYLIITFDDQHESIYNVALPLMSQYGFRATNAVNTGFIGRDGALSWDELEELEFVHGWETAGHTLYHANLPELNDNEALFQIERDWLNLKERNLSHETFVLPRGHATARDFKIIKKFYRNIRTSRDIRMHHPVDNQYLGYFAYITPYNAEDAIARISSAVLRKERVVIIGFHRFGDPEYSHNCDPEDFAQILDFIASQELEVLTIKEFVHLSQ